MARRELAALSRLQVIEPLPAEHGGKIVVLDWMRDLVRALDDPAILLLLVCLIRQSGKSQCALSVAVSELFRPNAFVLFMAASQQQAESVYHRKLRGPLRTLLASLGMPASAVRFSKRGCELPTLGSQLEIVAPNEFAPGRSPTLLVIDEPRDISDEAFATVVPSTIGAKGKVLIIGTPGRPSGFWFELVSHPPEEAWLYRSSTNDNPHASSGMLSFLRRQLALLMPSAARRELEGEFTESGDELISAALVDAAVDDRLGELPTHPGPAFAFVDLGRKRDLTSIVVVVVTAARQAEATDHLLVASVQTWSPKEAPTGEVDFAEVRSALARLPQRFPKLARLLVDEGAEAAAILPWARAQPGLAARVEGFTGSVAANMDLWSSLLGRLSAQTLSLPRHDRLIAELKGLRRQEFALGTRWRVIDASRQLHRDVSLALAGACMAAGQTRRCPHCADPECQWPVAPFGFFGDPVLDRWFAIHPPAPDDREGVEDWSARQARISQHRVADAERTIRELMLLMAAAAHTKQYDEADGRMVQIDAVIARVPAADQVALRALVRELGADLLKGIDDVED
jgi:hypothetical protein